MPRIPSLRISPSFRVLVSLRYHPRWLGNPITPLALTSASWYSRNAARRSIVKTINRADPLCELGLLPESQPTTPSRRTETRRPLSWALTPFSTSWNRGSTQHGLCLPAMFRLQGLFTLLTVSSPRSLAGSVSHRQRSWDSPSGAFSSRRAAAVSPPDRTHMPFPLPLLLPNKSEDRTGKPRLLGFHLRKSPWRPNMLLTRRPLVAPLGFSTRIRTYPAKTPTGLRLPSSSALPTRCRTNRQPAGTPEYRFAFARARQ